MNLLSLALCCISVLTLSGLNNFVDSIPSSAKTIENLKAPTVVRYRLDPSKSTFMVHANRAGLAWFKGHSHRIAAKDFSGEATLTLDALNPASLEITVKAASLEETDPVFTPQQKAIINKEVNELVLETAKYPEITFKSTGVKGAAKNGAFDVKISGDLMLHGVTKRIEIPATVTITGDTMRAVGEFQIISLPPSGRMR